MVHRILGQYLVQLYDLRVRLSEEPVDLLAVGDHGSGQLSEASSHEDAAQGQS